MNSVSSQKCGYASYGIEEKPVESERFKDIYNFCRLVKVKDHAERYEHADIQKGKKLHRKLGEHS